MRALVALALAVALLGVAAPAAAGSSSITSLRVTYWADGARKRESVTWTLRCGPPRGSHPRPVLSCGKLAAGGVRLFAPTPGNVACTEIYGGPQRARVVGTVNGKPVWATFSRSNGCAIDRWDRLAPWLLPRGGVT